MLNETSYEAFDSIINSTPHLFITELQENHQGIE